MGYPNYEVGPWHPSKISNWPQLLPLLFLSANLWSVYFLLLEFEAACSGCVYVSEFVLFSALLLSAVVCYLPESN